MTPRSLHIALAALALTLGATTAGAQDTTAPTAADLHWLTGCWERRAGTLLVEEQWTTPHAGILLGLSRTTRGDTLVGYEFMRIHARGGTLVFDAQPSGQPATQFVASAAARRELEFENAANDFPQRVRYRAVGADSLAARIEGVVDGQVRGIDFPYARVACAGASAR